jgi:hypothetical protein
LSIRPIALLIGAAVSVALITTGCGGSSSTSALTKAEFIKKADAACAKGSEQIKAEAAAYLKKSDGGKKQLGLNEAKYIYINEKILLPVLQQGVEEARALGAPSGEEDKVNAMLDAFEKGVEKGMEDPVALFSSSNPLAKGSEMLGKYGFKSCGHA